MSSKVELMEYWSEEGLLNGYRVVSFVPVNYSFYSEEMGVDVEVNFLRVRRGRKKGVLLLSDQDHVKFIDRSLDYVLERVELGHLVVRQDKLVLKGLGGLSAEHRRIVEGLKYV